MYASKRYVPTMDINFFMLLQINVDRWRLYFNQQIINSTCNFNTSKGSTGPKNVI